MIEPFRDVVHKRHGKSLEACAERGGLGNRELCVILGQPWSWIGMASAKTSEIEVEETLLSLINKYRTTLPTTQQS